MWIEDFFKDNIGVFFGFNGFRVFIILCCNSYVNNVYIIRENVFLLVVNMCKKIYEVYEDVYMYMNINLMKILFLVIYKFSWLEIMYKMNSLK